MQYHELVTGEIEIMKNIAGPQSSVIQLAVAVETHPIMKRRQAGQVWIP